MPTRPSTAHLIFIHDTLYHQFLEASCYDTATPYLGCVRELQHLYDLAATVPMEILSHDTRYVINGQADFRQWVAQVFEGGFALGFHQRLTHPS